MSIKTAFINAFFIRLGAACFRENNPKQKKGLAAAPNARPMRAQCLTLCLGYSTISPPFYSQ